MGNQTAAFSLLRLFGGGASLSAAQGLILPRQPRIKRPLSCAGKRQPPQMRESDGTPALCRPAEPKERRGKGAGWSPGPSPQCPQPCKSQPRRGGMSGGAWAGLNISILKIYLFTYLSVAVLGLRFCARAFSSCGERGPLFIAVRGPLTVAASLVAEHRLQTRRLSSRGSWA